MSVCARERYRAKFAALQEYTHTRIYTLPSGGVILPRHRRRRADPKGAKRARGVRGRGGEKRGVTVRAKSLFLSRARGSDDDFRPFRGRGIPGVYLCR